MARHPARGRGSAPYDGPGGHGGGGGIPDGLLIGLLGLLLAATLATWTATGLAGLLAHGSWPDGVSFTRAPLALRELATSPRTSPRPGRRRPGPSSPDTACSGACSSAN